MARIACLLVPDFAVAALVRAAPSLAGRPLALTAADGPRAAVVAASPAARRAGVRPGTHTVAQAHAACAALVVRHRDVAAERSAAAALADVAASLASRVERAADGTVFLDVDGSTHLVPSEAGL